LQLDSEILEHARLVLEQRSLLTDGELALTQAQLNPLNPHRHALGLGYDLSILSFDAKGKFIGDLSQTSLPQTDLLTSLDLLALWQTHGERQFELITYQHHYRASILPVQSSRVQSTRADASSAQTNAKHQGYVLLALPIDVHHHYLAEFNRQLKVLLIPESVKPAPTLSLSPPASTF
jgi:two-component system heavy metal sensor histidine kinase CusS